MAIEISGINELMLIMQQGGEKAVRGVAAEMRHKAEQTRDIARQMAPRDKSNLENSIEMDEDRSGINGRATFYVYVDESQMVPERPGKMVGDYAMLMHEGSYNLGQGSIAKQGESPYPVGPKYMERAALEIEQTLVADLTRAAKRSLT